MATATARTPKSRERVNFEVSETNREVLRSPGAVRKISVAVLVDGANVTAADGTVSFAPRGLRKSWPSCANWSLCRRAGRAARRCADAEIA